MAASPCSCATQRLAAAKSNALPRESTIRSSGLADSIVWTRGGAGPPSSLNTHLVQQVDEPPRARRQGWMLGFKLHRNPLQALGQRLVDRLGRRARRLVDHAFDIRKDLAKRLPRRGILLMSLGQFGMQFGEPLAQ